MAKIPFQATAPKTFSPLPNGTYLFRIEDVVEGQSKAGNPQLTVSHVIESDDQFSGRKVTRWFPIGGAGGFRLRGLVEAAIPDKVEITETDEKDEKGNVISQVDFDTDDLIGALYYADAITRDGDRGPQNDFRNERPYEETAAEGEDSEPEDEDEPEEQEEEAPVVETKKTETKPAAASGKGKPGSATAKVNEALKPSGKGKEQPAAAANGRTRERMRA